MILEEAGYHEFVDPNTNRTSYIMRLERGYYPRFHLYSTTSIHKEVVFDLHIDQKKVSYKDQPAHSGEYEGSLVEKEAERLKRWLTYYSQK